MLSQPGRFACPGQASALARAQSRDPGPLAPNLWPLGPGSAAHHSQGLVLRCDRDTQNNLARGAPRTRVGRVVLFTCQTARFLLPAALMPPRVCLGDMNDPRSNVKHLL